MTKQEQEQERGIKEWDGPPTWIGWDESNEAPREERTYRVLNLKDSIEVKASVYDGGDFDDAFALTVSLFNWNAMRIWTGVISDMDDDEDAVAEACRQMKLPRRGRIVIEQLSFEVKSPDTFEWPEDDDGE